MLPSVSSPSKPALRQQLRTARKALPLQARKRAQHDVTHKLVRFLTPRLRRHPHGRIASYDAMGSELDLGLLNRHFPTLYKPLLHRDGRLRFSTTATQRRVWARELQWIIVPLLGCDAAGHRLGQGGGWYDRTLASRTWRRVRTPYLIGVGFACQQVAHIPHEKHDVTLDKCVLNPLQSCPLNLT